MKYLISFFGLLLLSTSVSASTLADARDLALGGMSTSSVSPELSLFVNPAILSQGENLKTAFSQARLSATQFDYEISSCFPIFKDGIGMGIGWDALASRNQLATGIVRDSNGQVVVNPATGLPLTQILGFFTRNDNVFYSSAGAKLGLFSVGASLKYLFTNFGGMEAQGWGVDAGLHLRFSPDWSMGAAFFDLGNSVLDFHGGAPNETTAASFAASLSWNAWHNDDFSVRLEPAIYRLLFTSGSFKGGGGIEASWKQDFFIRAGFNQDRASFGVGLVTHPGKVFPEVKVDYAYLGGNVNDFPSRLTLTVAW